MIRPWDEAAVNENTEKTLKNLQQKSGRFRPLLKLFRLSGIRGRRPS